MLYELTVNGRRCEVDAAPLKPLAIVLREELGLTGTKIGCMEGRCGACTVGVDGKTVVSCLYPVALAVGAAVRTVEGLAAPDGALSPLQNSMLEAGGVQCGACTPGVLMSLSALLDANPTPTDREVREALSGNICRCTGYQKIIDAVLAVRGVAR